MFFGGYRNFFDALSGVFFIPIAIRTLIDYFVHVPRSDVLL